MNEIRDLIVGIDFGKEYSQICYYDRKGDEARSLSMKAGGNQYEAPCILCWRPEQKDYCVGLEADYFVREKGGVMIDDVYGICEKSDSVLVEGQELAPWEILAQFLQGMLKFLGVAELVKNTKCVAVTLPGLTEIQVENFQKAFEIIGFPHEKYMLLDYGESFYYYVLSQKRETWNRSVGWYAFTPENVSFRKMTMNGATKPVTVKLEEAVETELPAEGQERDSEFGKFVQKTLGRDLFSSIQITGDGFSQDWAEQSVRLLCYQKRKVFYGNNLFARGACAAGAERFITQELKELEDLILGAEDKLAALEYELFCDVRDRVASQVERIQKTARAVALLDVIASLSFVAERQNYVKPQINERGILDIKNGRHPVVEQMIPNDMFISNDTYLDNKKNRVAIITGPNMAGKSTYMRQVALIVLMAQIGSFVPAAKANIGIVDRIFTRVGASDDLASGQSTFMVEMSEVANILRNATKNSLLILDEIGRGTSTFDGLSIAWAVVEYISNSKLLGAKTLFATHYHELTELEGKIDSVHNYCIAVKEQGDDIVFLRKIVKGGADKSYGVQVAKLAGVPDAVINRAKEIARELEEHDLTSGAKDIMPYGEAQQLSFFRESDEPTMEHPFMAELREKYLSDMTPLEALNYLYVLQEKLKNEE